MTLPSGQISMSQIRDEFGAGTGNGQVGLSQLYAGGAYVPSGTSGTSGAIPSSGAISFSKFKGASNNPLVVTSPDYNEFEPSGVDMYLTISATATGGSGNYTYSWTMLYSEGDITIQGSTTNSTLDLKCTTPNRVGDRTAYFRCDVSDGNSTAFSAPEVYFEWEDLDLDQ